jgi:AAA domain
MRNHPNWARSLPQQGAKIVRFSQQQLGDAAFMDGEQPEVDSEAMLRFLDIHTWANLDISPETRFLGDVLTDSRRVFLVGSTGLGKSQLAHAIGAGIASGQSFLDWESDRPDGARVLVIDGEMSSRTLKKRAAAAIRRETLPIGHGSLILFSLDRTEEFVSLFPGLGKPAALNKPEGARFMLNLIKATQPDVVIFDNVMSLTEGDQKDEITWKLAEPLIKTITGLSIGQVWLDHTGHDRSRQYGANAKAWIMDAVGVMTAQPDNGNGTVSFKLSFNYPGKARHRCEENEADYEDRIIRLSGDVWSSEAAGQAKAIADAVMASGHRKQLLKAAGVVLAAKGAEHTLEGGEVVRAAKVGDWRAHILDGVPEDKRNAARVAFNREIADLEENHGAILTDGERRKQVFWLPTEPDLDGDGEDC